MKKQKTFSVILGGLVALGLGLSASAALVTVNSTETWDGEANPHAAEGVTLTGTGDLSDPYTYTIPNGLHITSTGKINLWSGAHQSRNIKFVIEGGDLQMDAGGVLNHERYAVRSGFAVFILDLSGTNSITGAGSIGQRNHNDSTFRDLTIQNVKNISLTDIFMRIVNGNRGPADFAHINITASGSFLSTGTVDNSDRDTGGDGAGNITIQANTIDVNLVDARGFRNDPAGRDPYSGNVTLRALSPLGNYDPADAVNNASTNKLIVRGAIRTMSVDPETIDGNVTLESVAQQLVFGPITVPPFATITSRVGKVQGGATVADLFVDVGGSGPTPVNDVDWSGAWTPPAGSPPAFTSDPVIRANATANQAYAGTLAGTATDPDNDPLTYARNVIAGPAWLQVAANGDLSGTPGLNDGGPNTWQISVTDGSRFDSATLEIFVDAPPRWLGANFTYPNGEQGVDYAGTLTAQIIYYRNETLTFRKVSGPVWLTVAADGTLSGTPHATNVLNNVFVVSVSDSLGTNQATLNIFVNGSPKFPNNPFVRATAFLSDGNYSIRNQTLAGAATDPQDPANPNTLTWTKVGGPGWLDVAPDGSLSGTPTAGDLGINTFTVSAANAYPATTATLRINVAASAASAPVEVVTREYWDGVDNPHAAEGVTLTGTGTADDPATYTVPRGLSIYGAGQIYTSKPTGALSQQPGSATYVGSEGLHIRFNIEGNLSLDANNNAFVTAVHARNSGSGQKHLILDLNGTNSIVGQGRIVGLGNRVDAVVFPDCFDNDVPRILTISNVVDVSLYDINLQVRNANNWGRPLNILATGKVQVTDTIDNSDRQGGGDGGNHVTVIGKTVTVSNVLSYSSRTSSFRNVGNITLTALAPPGFNPADGVNNNSNNWITVTGNLRASTPQTNDTWGAITTESVVLEFGAGATINAGVATNTLPGKLSFTVGQIKNGAVATDLFRNQSTSQTTDGALTANYIVDWSGTVPAAAPPRPTLQLSPSAPGQIVLYWTGSGFVLQQNGDLSNPGGWVNAPSGTANPATNVLGSGTLFYRLKWPQ
ncbi:MAG: hypothetical protein FJ387_12570 [Verrucomicrobia bacterium]|nr:hypothetical protein [Verrucomicrobiota bacterium]